MTKTEKKKKIPQVAHNRMVNKGEKKLLRFNGHVMGASGGRPLQDREIRAAPVAAGGSSMLGNCLAVLSILTCEILTVFLPSSFYR